MTEFYHMSSCSLSVGDVVRGHGGGKVDSQIEDALENARPAEALSRFDAVFSLSNSDFSRCGIVNPGYIYKVKHEGLAERRDLSWIGPMQNALLKLKYKNCRYAVVEQYPDWSDSVVADCCKGYWTGMASGDPVWEYLSTTLVIIEVVADQLVDPAATKGGWTS